MKVTTVIYNSDSVLLHQQNLSCSYNPIFFVFFPMIQVPYFQVDVWFCSDKRIKKLNEEWREVSKPTDILSFPANDFESPGVFSDDSSLQFEKHLGDLVVSPEYVMRQCKRDKIDFEVRFLYYFIEV